MKVILIPETTEAPGVTAAVFLALRRIAKELQTKIPMYVGSESWIQEHRECKCTGFLRVDTPSMDREKL